MSVPEERGPPPVVRRLRRWYFLAALIPLLGAVRSHFWASLPPWAMSPLISFSIPLGMLTAFVVVYLFEERLYRRAARAGGMACPCCLYPLEGPNGACPECGEPFTTGGLRRAWSESARREFTWRL